MAGGCRLTSLFRLRCEQRCEHDLLPLLHLPATHTSEYGDCRGAMSKQTCLVESLSSTVRCLLTVAFARALELEPVHQDRPWRLTWVRGERRRVVLPAALSDSQCGKWERTGGWRLTEVIALVSAETECGSNHLEDERSLGGQRPQYQVDSKFEQLRLKLYWSPVGSETRSFRRGNEPNQWSSSYSIVRVQGCSRFRVLSAVSCSKSIQPHTLISSVSLSPLSSSSLAAPQLTLPPENALPLPGWQRCTRLAASRSERPQQDVVRPYETHRPSNHPTNSPAAASPTTRSQSSPASTRIQLEPSDIKALIAALHYVYASAVRWGVEGVVLLMELEQLGLPKDVCTAMVKEYDVARDELRQHMKHQTLTRQPSTTRQCGLTQWAWFTRSGDLSATCGC